MNEDIIIIDHCNLLSTKKITEEGRKNLLKFQNWIKKFIDENNISIILNGETFKSNKMTERDIKKLIKGLDIDDEKYLIKLQILHKLICAPYGIIISDDMVDWCKEIGLDPQFCAEDKATWWTCSLIKL